MEIYSTSELKFPTMNPIFPSVGLSGVWMVNAANMIYYRVGTRGDTHTAGSKVWP